MQERCSLGRTRPAQNEPHSTFGLLDGRTVGRPHGRTVGQSDGRSRCVLVNLTKEGALPTCHDHPRKCISLLTTTVTPLLAEQTSSYEPHSTFGRLDGRTVGRSHGRTVGRLDGRLDLNTSSVALRTPLDVWTVGRSHGRTAGRTGSTVGRSDGRTGGCADAGAKQSWPNGRSGGRTGGRADGLHSRIVGRSDRLSVRRSNCRTAQNVVGGRTLILQQICRNDHNMSSSVVALR